MIGSRPTTGLGQLFGTPPRTPVEDDLRDAVAESQARQGLVTEGARSFLEWAAKVPEPRGPLDFDRFAFQRDLYSQEVEQAHDVVVMKGTQIGISAWLIRWCLRRADRGKTIMYIFPGGAQMADFVRLRIDPVINRSPYLRQRTADRKLESPDEKVTNNVRAKSVGPGTLLMRGSRSLDDLQSIDADAIAFDEYNRLAQGNIPEAEQRTTGPMSDDMKRRVGVPTIPNFGISEAYAESDQRAWTVRCAMGHWNPMRGAETLADNVDAKAGVLVCKQCRRPLDVRKGEWVASYADRDRIGFQIPKFAMYGADIPAIVERSRATSPAAIKSHRNSDLGESWQSAEAGLSQANLDAATRDYSMSPQGYQGDLPVTMGVDVAVSRALNVRISAHVTEHRKRALWIGQIDDGIAPWGPMPGVSAFDILRLVMSRFRVRMVAIDHLPDGRLVRAFCADFPGRAWRVMYVEQRKVIDFDEPEQAAKVRQLETIDATVSMVQRQANELPLDRPGPDPERGTKGYDAEMQARVLDTTIHPETGAVHTGWQKTGADDYLQCEVYDVVATHAYYASLALGEMTGAEGSSPAGGGEAPDVAPEDQPGFTESAPNWQSGDEWSAGIGDDDGQW